MSDLALRSASELAALLRVREVGCLELLEHTLARVERHNPALNAIVAMDLEGARARAREADAALARGESWGPLHGLPVTVKDAIEVAGMPTTSGAPELASHRPGETAPSAQRLVDAGAVVFGKTNLPLYAGDFQSYNEVYGTTHNPWDLSRVPGGSSGGSAAAIAAGLSALELGSDIGGSIRNPSHYCGVYGHKPSYGIVPMRGHIPGPPGQLAEDDVNTIGPLARSAEDCALALDVIAGPDRWERVGWRLELPPPRAERLADFRVALWLDDPLCPPDRVVRGLHESAADALRKAGVRIDDRARPEIDTAHAFETYLHLLYAVLTGALPDKLIAGFEAAREGLSPDEHGPGAALVRGATQRHREWRATNEARARLRARWADFFRDFDVLLCPVMPTAAFPHDHSEIAARTVEVDGTPLPYLNQVFWAGLASVALLPASVAPVGRTAQGLPVGLQIVGPRLEDRTTLAFAARLRDVVGGFEAPPGFA